MPRVIAVIPTWNEKENIGPLLQETLATDPSIEALVVDDHSPDGTWEIVRRLAEREPRVHLLLRKGPRGRGFAGIAGFQKALEMGADAVIEMDADFSHHPRYLPAFIRALETHDFVLGSRYIPGGRDEDRGALRQWISRGANAYARLVLDVPIRDCTSGYRGYRRRVLEGIGLDAITTWGPAVLSDILFRVGLKGFSMTEIPIEFIDRRAGQSTLTTKILLEGLWNILRLRLNKRKILALLP